MLSVTQSPVYKSHRAWDFSMSSVSEYLVLKVLVNLYVIFFVIVPSFQDAAQATACESI